MSILFAAATMTRASLQAATSNAFLTIRAERLNGVLGLKLVFCEYLVTVFIKRESFQAKDRLITVRFSAL